MIEEEELVAESEYIGGMSDEEINAKHVRIRGSLALKYPRRENCCRNECGINDYRQPNGKPPIQHRCFLAVGHMGSCEFSSECVAS